MRVGQRAERVGLELELGQRVVARGRRTRRQTTSSSGANRLHRRQHHVVEARAGRRPAPVPGGSGTFSVVPAPAPRPVSCASPVIGQSGYWCSETASTLGSSQNTACVPLPWCTSQSTTATRADAVHRLGVPDGDRRRWPAGRSPWRAPAPRGARAGAAATSAGVPPSASSTAATAPPAASSAACQESGRGVGVGVDRAPSAQASMTRVEVAAAGARARGRPGRPPPGVPTSPPRRPPSTPCSAAARRSGRSGWPVRRVKIRVGVGKYGGNHRILARTGRKIVRRRPLKFSRTAA